MFVDFFFRVEEGIKYTIREKGRAYTLTHTAPSIPIQTKTTRARIEMQMISVKLSLVKLDRK